MRKREILSIWSLDNNFSALAKTSETFAKYTFLVPHDLFSTISYESSFLHTQTYPVLFLSKHARALDCGPQICAVVQPKTKPYYPRGKQQILRQQNLSESFRISRIP